MKDALAAGYRHIDTAAVYGNEESVGQAVKEAGIPREEVWCVLCCVVLCCVVLCDDVLCCLLSVVLSSHY